MSVEITQSLQTFTVNSIIEFWLYLKKVELPFGKKKIQIDPRITYNTTDIYTFVWSCILSLQIIGNQIRGCNAEIIRWDDARLGGKFNPEAGLFRSQQMKQGDSKKMYQYCSYEGSVYEGGNIKQAAFIFQSSALVCWFVCPGAKEWVSVFFLVHYCWSPLIQETVHFFKNFSFLSFSPPRRSSSPSLPNTYPTLFCPSCPFARSEVETCVSLHLHGRERKKSEVRSLPPLSLTLPSEESRQTGAEHGTFINPRQIAMNPLHIHWLV